MSTLVIFNVQLVLGYVVWLLVLGAYVAPRVKSLDGITVQRAIAALHSFRFFGLVFIVPGVVGNLPAPFAIYAAYGDFITGVLAVCALATIRVRPLFWAFVVAFNVVGVVDLIGDYYHAVQFGVPQTAGQLAATYAIPVLYVPLLMITHVFAFYLLLRRGSRAEVPGLRVSRSMR